MDGARAGAASHKDAREGSMPTVRHIPGDSRTHLAKNILGGVEHPFVRSQ